MADQKYVPILKWKAGEKAALNRLEEEQKDIILPLLEIVDYEDPSNLLEGIFTCFRRPAYVDSSVIDTDNREYLLSLCKISKEQNISIYPVLNFEDFPGNANAFLPFVTRVAIRIPFPESIDGAPYKDIFSAINDWKEKNDLQMDIIIDLDYIESKQKASILLLELKNVLKEYVSGNSNIEKIILSMTTFPTILNDIEAGSNAAFERYELEIYKRILQSKELDKIKNQLIFSDYGVTRFTESEIDFTKLKYGILPKARYTTQDKYWVHKGQKDTKTREFLRSSKDIAKYIYKASYYYGESFSFGDLDIKERALENKGPGNSKDWVTIAANHHIVVVISELSNPHAF